MKKLLILPFLLVPLFSKPVNTMTVEESISDFDVTVKLCKVQQSRYCLIVNSFDEIQSFKCRAGFFRYKENEIRTLNLVTEGIEYETIEGAIEGVK